MQKKLTCQACLKNEFEFRINQTKWFCSDSCRSQFSKSINSLLSPNDETSHIIRARMQGFLNEYEFDIAEKLFLEHAFQRLSEALYAHQKPLTAFELVTDWLGLYKKEMLDLSDAHRNRISGTLKALGYVDYYLWSR